MISLHKENLKCFVYYSELKNKIIMVYRAHSLKHNSRKLTKSTFAGSPSPARFNAHQVQGQLMQLHYLPYTCSGSFQLSSPTSKSNHETNRDIFNFVFSWETPAFELTNCTLAKATLKCFHIVLISQFLVNYK